MLNVLSKLAARLAAVDESAVRVSLRPAIDYQSNRLYDVRVTEHHWIAKVYLKPDEFDDAPRREYQTMQLLAHLDIAPRAVHREPQSAAHGPLVIYEYMAGQMWDRHTPTDDDMRQLAALWLMMHRVSSNGLWLSRGQETPLPAVESRFRASFERYHDWAAVHHPPGTAIARLCLDLLAKRKTIFTELAAMPTPLCFCRADPRFANVIRRPDGRLGMVDWEDSGLRDPAREMADLISHPNQEDLVSAEGWRVFFAPYFAERTPADPDLPQRIRRYLGLTSLFWLALLLNGGIERHTDRADWLVNGMPANQRLNRYLARTVAWPDEDFEAALGDMTFFPNSNTPPHGNNSVTPC